MLWLLLSLAAAQLPFETTWKTTLAGELITLPITVQNGSTITVSWGDGNSGNFSNTTAVVNHTYLIPGDHNVSISGKGYTFGFNFAGDTQKLVNVRRWGNLEINKENMFAGCKNLQVSALDQPNITTPTSTLVGMFRNSSFNSPLNWNLENYSFLPKLDYMFEHATALNQPINFTSSQYVISMISFLDGATSFNQLVTLRTDGVTRMDYAFRNAQSFNRPLSFNTTKVVSMEGMFQNAIMFNQAVNFNAGSGLNNTNFMFAGATSFNSSVSFLSTPVPAATMDGMFMDAKSFNQPIELSTAVSVRALFKGASSFNQPIVLPVRADDASDMFHSATSFNHPISVVTYNLRKVDFMFANATSFNSNVTITDSLNSTRGMFQGASSFNQFLLLQTFYVTDMTSMFEGASSFNRSVTFATSNVQSMDRMFANATAFNQPINFTTTNLSTCDGMFLGATSFNSPIQISGVTLLSTKSMFENARMFNQNVTFLIAVKFADFMFKDAIRFNQPLIFPYSLVSVVGMFQTARAFNQNVSVSRTRPAAAQMFQGAVSFNSPVTFENGVSSVASMFDGALAFNQPIELETQGVDDFSGMFRNAIVFNSEVRLLTENATSFRQMFAYATKFNQTLNFTTNTVTDMSEMFLDVIGFRQDLRGWDTSGVKNCSQFCYACPLPAFPRCGPCSPQYQSSSVNVCNCPQNNCTAVLPRILSSAALILRTPTYRVAKVAVPLNPIFLNRTLLLRIADSDPNATGGSGIESDTVVSVDLHDDNDTLVPANGLPNAVSFIFALIRPMTLLPVTQCMGEQFIVAPILPDCGYLNVSTGEWQRDGCERASFNATHVQCNCTHFTLFAVISPKHNAVVPTGVLDLTPTNIAASPTGLITVMIILCLFAMVFVVAGLRDRAEAAEYEQLRLSKHEKWKNFAAENRKTTFLKQLKIAFQKRHTWFSLVFRKSGTSFRAVDRTCVTLLSVFASMSMSAFYHAQDNNNMARVGVIIISVLVCAIPAQLLIQLFVRTGPVGFYEEWEQSRKPPRTSKCAT